MDKIEIQKNADGIPSVVKVTFEGRDYTANYDQNTGFTFNKSNVPSGVLDYLKLVFPFTLAPKTETLESGTLVSSNSNAANGTVNYYTVPANQKLYIQHLWLTTHAIAAVGAGDDVQGVHYFQPMPATTPGITFLRHDWHYKDTNIMNSEMRHLDYPIAAGSLMVLAANVNSHVYGGFIGVLKNA